jgi:signal-transduction protein with cAMP-binding, CBS, and nucleotidyltransferase domain
MSVLPHPGQGRLKNIGTVEKDIGKLKQLKFFSEFEAPVAEKIIQSCELREYKVKDIIIEEYQELSELFILVEGAVVLGINIPRKGRINLDTIHPGQIFSWSAMFPPHISTALAMATQPVKVLAIKATKLMQMMEDDDAFGYRFMSIISHTLSQRLADTRLHLVNIISI